MKNKFKFKNMPSTTKSDLMIYYSTGVVLLGSLLFITPTMKKLYKKYYGNNREITHICWFNVEVENFVDFNIDIGLYMDSAPKSINNFLTLVQGSEKGSYKGTNFHAIVPRYMMALGDISNGDGTGHFSIYNNNYIEDEKDSKLSFYSEGVVALCNQGKPNTNGSQFFITLDDIPYLNGNYTIIGQVIEGLDGLKHVAEKVGTIDGEARTKITIKDCGIYNYNEYLNNKNKDAKI